MEETEQIELDFEREDLQLRVRSEVQSLLEVIEGPITPQHFSSLIGKAIERGLGTALGPDLLRAVQEYAESLSSRSKLDVDHLLELVFPSVDQAA